MYYDLYGRYHEMRQEAFERGMFHVIKIRYSDRFALIIWRIFLESKIVTISNFRQVKHAFFDCFLSHFLVLPVIIYEPVLAAELGKLLKVTWLVNSITYHVHLNWWSRDHDMYSLIRQPSIISTNKTTKNKLLLWLFHKLK